MADTIQILTTSTFSNSATLQSAKAKGDAYFGTNDGLHTIMVDLAGFIGTIKIQGSLETTPAETDWFDTELELDNFTVDTTGLVTKLANSLAYSAAETSVKAYNTTGNLVWLRADISNWTAGTISRIELNR